MAEYGGAVVWGDNEQEDTGESRNSVKELVTAIKEYIKSWNKESKPFRWTKSAGEIMGSIKKQKPIIQTDLDRTIE
jgi:hypothetical protein